MTTKHYTQDMLDVSEVVENDRVVLAAVSVPETAFGNADAKIFICEPIIIDKPYIRGEDYPILTQVWNNSEDDIYDTL
jgi:hypothetical protein